MVNRGIPSVEPGLTSPSRCRGAPNFGLGIDEIQQNLDDGVDPYDATILAGITRVRPVVLAAATTVLGVIPLLQDAFWVSMAMTIMAGPTVGTILTMILHPTFYTIVHGIRVPAKKS